jgi:metal-responsive CopG/Arc/MetJ family transcriptional regulator
MRHSVSIDEEIGKEVEAVAKEEGISISEFCTRAAEQQLKRVRQRRAIEELDRRAGQVEAHGDIDQALEEIREKDTERP